MINYFVTMETNIIVVNVKVAYIRPKYRDLKDWMSDDNNIYIGRRGIVFIPDETGSKKRYPPTDSYWANPFRISKNMNRDQIVTQYREHIVSKLDRDGWDKLNELIGKNLGCWCKPEACHGDVLIDLVSQRCSVSSDKL